LAVFISEDNIADIINAADIVDVISEVVVLKKAGREHIGLCPFHSEKTPSFTVNPEKKVFYCHGCHEGGNVFSFIIKHNGISFPDAAKLLARRYGIAISNKAMPEEQKKRISSRDSLLSVNRGAMDFFCKAMHSHPKGKEAIHYLHNRGIKTETMNNFGLGYALNGWDHLVTYFSKEKASLALVEKAGLIVNRKEQKGFYDRFRNRIIFPIIDGNNDIIGFGGRVLDDSMPKYLNSPETPLYNKSRSLFGIHRARNVCRQSSEVYIVEGYFDLLALHQHGIQNSVATLGTSLTKEHVRILKGIVGETGKIVLVYDSDVAGIAAANRSIDIFNNEYVEAKILVLPSGHDPDSYLFEFGEKAFADAAKKALTPIRFLTQMAISRYGLTTEGKIKIFSDIQEKLASVEDSVKRSLYIKEFSEYINIDESAVLEKVREIASKHGVQNNLKRTQGRFDSLTLKNQETKGKSECVAYDKGTIVERHIISLMLQYPKILPKIRKYGVLAYFNNKALESIGQTIVKHMDKPGAQISELINLVDNNDQKNLVAFLSVTNESFNIKAVDKLIQRFIENRKNRSENSLPNLIKVAEESKDDAFVLQLLEEANLRLKTLKDDQAMIKKNMN
jgi:DNA primase